MNLDKNALVDGKGGDPGNAEYSVGYARPPKATQFKKGQSGNRAGRPKTPTISDIRIFISNILEEPTTIRSGGRERTVSKYEMMIWREVEAALKGDSVAIHSLFNRAEKFGLLSVAEQKKFLEIVDPDAEDELIIAYVADKARRARDAASNEDQPAPAKSKELKS